MNEPAGENGALRLLFVYITHNKSNDSSKQRNQHNKKRIGQGNKHRAMQQRKENALNDISRIKPEFVTDPFQKEASEKQFLGKGGLDKGIDNGPSDSGYTQSAELRRCCFNIFGNEQ